MRGSLRAVAAVLGITLGVAVLTGQDKTDPNKTDPDKPAVRPVTDAEFIILAVSGGRYAVESGKLAKQQAEGDAVKKFAEKMAEEHAKANKELAEVAKKADLGLPVDFMQDHARMLNVLKGKRGAEFDKEYLRQQVRAHDEAVALFENASKNAKNAEVKAFAAKTLPAVKMHQEEVRKLGGTEESKDKVVPKPLPKLKDKDKGAGGDPDKR